MNQHQLNYALELQRKGLTFTEIADVLRLDREDVVQALYWDRMVAIEPVAFVTERVPYVGARA